LTRTSRTALVAGAVGRRGEALLNRVLGSGDYDGVVALADAPMALGMRALRLAALESLPPLVDAFILESAPEQASSRSFYGRDAPFVQVHPGNLLAIASAAVAQGARRMVLVSPMPGWQQVGAFHRGLGDATELAVAQLPLESLVVLRPTPDSGRAARNLLERVASIYLSLQLLMMPKSVQSLTSEQLARAAIEAMRAATPGVRVIGADRIAELLGTPP
jgi:hypothetical protein